MKSKIYLHFNSTLSNNIYDILFHDQNPLAGHFQSLLCKRQTNTNNSHENNEKLMKYENIEQQWTKIENKMLESGLQRAHEFNSSDGENCFKTICHLTKNEYDVPCLRNIMENAFTNAIMHNDPFAFRCIEKYIKTDIQKHV